MIPSFVTMSRLWRKTDITDLADECPILGAKRTFQLLVMVCKEGAGMVPRWWYAESLVGLSQ